MYVNTITVRMQAIRSASLSVLPDFSPRALAQSLQSVFIADDQCFPDASTIRQMCSNRSMCS